MNYAAKKDGVFTGTLYPAINDAIRLHHSELGETLEPVNGRLINNGTDESPDWQPDGDPNEAPLEVTMRQARIILHRHGYLANIPTAIASLQEPVKTEAEIEWEYAQTVRRDSPLVAMLQQALSIDDATIQQMFREAIVI